MQLPAAWRDRVLDDAQRRAPDWMRDVPALVDQIRAELDQGQGLARGGSTPVGYLRRDALAVLLSGVDLSGRKLARPPAPPASALIAIEQARLLHAMRDAHAKDKTLIDAELRVLYERLAAPAAVYWDDGQPQTPDTRAEGPALIYVWKLADGRVVKAVIQVNWHAQRTRGMKGAAVQMNWVRTVVLIKPEHLADRRYKLLEGGL
jgi:hypothetical protein